MGIVILLTFQGLPHVNVVVVSNCAFPDEKNFECRLIGLSVAALLRRTKNQYSVNLKTKSWKGIVLSKKSHRTYFPHLLNVFINTGSMFLKI
jgi:hypothetical protein